MAKKSQSRLNRDQQRAQHATINGLPQAKPKEAGNWNEATQLNTQIAGMLYSTRTVVDQHNREPDLVEYSPTPELFLNAKLAVEKNFTEMVGEVIGLKDQIKGRTGRVKDPDETVELLQVHIGHGELVSKLDGVFRPSLAIFQEQINVARGARKIAMGGEIPAGTELSPEAIPAEAQQADAPAAEAAQ